MLQLHLRVKFDSNYSMEELDRKTGAPFVKALLEEIHTAFDMSSINPKGDLYMVGPIEIPTENVIEYGNKKLEILFGFYRKSLQGSHESHTVASPAQINCTH